MALGNLERERGLDKLRPVHLWFTVYISVLMVKGNKGYWTCGNAVPMKLQRRHRKGPWIANATMKHKLEWDSVTTRSCKCFQNVNEYRSKMEARERKDKRKTEGGGKMEEGGKEKGKELTFGAWLSSQPWRPWVPPLAFFSQGSCADHLNDRTWDYAWHGSGWYCILQQCGWRN